MTSRVVGEGEDIVVGEAIALAMEIAGKSQAATGGGVRGGSGSGIVLPAVQDSDLLVLVLAAPILAVIKKGLGRCN
jgi:hypothetical protein